MNCCIICTEKYNKTTRAPVGCPYCHYDACRQCMETYLLGEAVARCINPDCRKEWTRRMLVDTMTKSFMTTKYRVHMQTVLYDTQLAMMPETQVLIPIYRYKQQLDEEAVRLHARLEALREEMHMTTLAIRRISDERVCIITNFNIPITLNTAAVNECCTQLENGERTISNVISGDFVAWQFGGVQSVVQKSQFHRKCGDADCRGYLSTQWKCGLCSKWTCKDCHKLLGLHRDGLQEIPDDGNMGIDVVGEVHVCDPNEVATAQLLSRDTKPCPKCNTPIHKIDGCDQMWCTQCRTAFSWRSGAIETRIHNPHYYAWLRENSVNGEIPRNPGDGGCVDEYDLDMRMHNLYAVAQDIQVHINTRGLRTYRVLIKSFYAKYKQTYVQPHYVPIDDMYTLVRNVMHLYEVDYRSYFRIIQTDERENRNLRIAYLNGDVDETRMKQLIHMRHKKYLKHTELCQVLEMFINSVFDIMSSARHIIHTMSHTCDVNEFDEITERAFQTLTGLNKLVEYTNSALKDAYTTFSSVPYQLNYMCQLVREV